jgi:hypothetical protein
VFLTGNYKYGVGGAWRGTLCSYKQDRISISQYAVDDMYTAEVRSFLNLVYPMNLSTVFPHIAAAATIFFLEFIVRQVFKGGNYTREETIVFLIFVTLLTDYYPRNRT